MERSICQQNFTNRTLDFLRGGGGNIKYISHLCQYPAYNKIYTIKYIKQLKLKV